MLSFATHFPHESNANHGGLQVHHHNNRTNVLEARCQVCTGKNPAHLESSLRDTECSSEKRFLYQTLDDEFAKVCNAAINDFVQKHVKGQEPNLRIKKCFLDLIPFDGSVENSSATELGSSDEDCFVLQAEAFR